MSTFADIDYFNPQEFELRKREDDRIRVGIIGCGKMGLLHASLLNVLPMTHLVVICEKSARMRKWLRKMFNGVPIVGDLTELSERDLDAVYVTTPISTHLQVIKSARAV